MRRESAHAHVDNNLPFELKALEAALTHAVIMMEEDAVQLNNKVSPVLDCLAYKVHSHHMHVYLNTCFNSSLISLCSQYLKLACCMTCLLLSPAECAVQSNMHICAYCQCTVVLPNSSLLPMSSCTEPYLCTRRVGC